MHPHIYIWAEIPDGYKSDEFSDILLDKCGVVVAPGNGYGKYGEGYFRISLTISNEKLHEAFQRIKATLIPKIIYQSLE